MAYKKGHPQYNTGRTHFKKGQHYSLKTEFKKGNIPWNKNLKGIHLSPKSEFKKGQPAPMKGRKVKEKFVIANRKRRKKYFEEHPEEKERMKKQRAKQILPIKDTSIEVKIQNFLKKLGIEFFTHQHMNIKHDYQCDILIPIMNLVIECDGVYWHKYPVGRDIDHIRTSELIDKGFKVLRLWEFEIKEMNLNDFKDKIRKFK